MKRQIVAVACAVTSGLLALTSLISSPASGAATPSTEGKAGAEAFLELHYKRPTQIAVTAPFTKPFPKGKTIDFLQCPLEACVLVGDTLQQVANKVGWTLVKSSVDGTPTGYQTALQQAERSKPDGVIAGSPTTSTVLPEYAALKAEGIPVVVSAVSGPLVPGLTYNVDTDGENAGKGRLMAAYAVAKANQKPNVLYVDLPDLLILTQLGDAFKTALKGYCSSCSFASINVPLSDIGTTSTNQIVSYLRTHTSVNTVAVSYDGLVVGLPAALKSAGLSNVKIIGESPSVQNIEYIEAGQEEATATFDNTGDAYAQIDALARYFTGQKVNQNTQPPLWIVDKKNLPVGTNLTTLFPVVANTEAAYLKLWNFKQ